MVETPTTMDKLIYKDLEPGIINADMIQRAAQLFKDESGRTFQLTEIVHEKITVLRLEFQNIIKIDHLWILPNLRILSLSNNKIDKIENLETLQHLHELNLSYNHIETIENLDNLQALEILSLYGNRIQRIENLENLQKLVILSVGNNQIATVSGIERLRFIKTLRSLNMQRNPVTDENFHLYVAVVLPQLKYNAYLYIHQEDRERGSVMFRGEVREIEEAELNEIEDREWQERERAVHVKLKQCFVENLCGHGLFESLFEGDEDAKVFLSVGGGVDEILADYRQEAFEITQRIYAIGVAQDELRHKEIEIFQECLENCRKVAQLEEQRHIREFLDQKAEILSNAIAAADSGDSVKPFSDLSDALQTQMTQLLQQTWNTLMETEIVLFEQIEANIKDFNHLMRDMMRQFFQEVQVEFALLSEAERSFVQSVVDVVQAVMSSGTQSGAFSQKLGDKDFVEDAAARMQTRHLKIIDEREEKLFDRGTEWAAHQAEEFLSQERIRNRAKISEINHLIDYHRIGLQKMLSPSNLARK